MTDPLPRLNEALRDRYRVERELGHGGMATVYLAHDLKHDRKVAVKVLRPELAAVIGADRFLAEIKTTANLQHPHILALFDSGQVDGTVFYVMPFVEGESLRDRLVREKQLSVSDAVRIATEVAGALDYAHRHQVIHRDIKPENILLHDGRALVADFGIALAASRTEGGSRMTETGMSLGTPHYMSPEQALGERDLDARTDIYALGCVLHEMLAGEPPFSGPTAQAVIARVMSSEPEPVTMLRKTVPEHVADAILTALAKLPVDRFATGAEFALALGGAGSGSTRQSGAVRTTRRSARVRLLWPIALGLTSVAAVWGWFRPAPDSLGPPPTRLAVVAPGIVGIGAGLTRQIALTPDGRTLLYTAMVGGREQVVRLDLGSVEGRAIPGMPDNATGLAMSQDGRQFFASLAGGGGLYRFPVDGGSAKPLPPEVPNTANVAWASDGSLWLSAETDITGGIAKVSPENVVTRPFGATHHELSMMQILPGDRTALTVLEPEGTASGPIYLLDLEKGEAALLLDVTAVEVRYTAGHLVYVLANGSMEAVPFDHGSLRVQGPAVTIATGVTLNGTGQAEFAVAANGTVAYMPEEPRSLVLMDRAGTSRQALEERRNFHAPVFSPDGRRLSMDFNTIDGRDVWVLDLASGTLTRVTFDRDGHDAVWEPDGRFLTYTSFHSGSSGVYRVRPGGAEPAESLLASPLLTYTGLWLSDKSALVTAAGSLTPGSQSDIAIVRNGGRGPVEPLVATRFQEIHPALSPDDRWIAFNSTQSGQEEIYLRPLNGEGDQIKVSLAGGVEPLWSPDGRELFYRAGTELVAATITTSPTLAVTSRQTLFSVADIATSNPHTNYGISPDGRTFAMVKLNPASRIMIIQNLPALVRELTGGARTTP